MIECKVQITTIEGDVEFVLMADSLPAAEIVVKSIVESGDNMNWYNVFTEERTFSSTTVNGQIVDKFSSTQIPMWFSNIEEYILNLKVGSSIMYHNHIVLRES